MTPRKTFDCVEMKHRAAQKVQARMSSMTISERIDYLNRIAADFRIKGSIPILPEEHEDLPHTGTDN